MGEQARVEGSRDAERFLEGAIRDAIGVARLALETTGSRTREFRSRGIEALDRALVLSETLSRLDRLRIEPPSRETPLRGETLGTILVTVLQGREHVDARDAVADGAQLVPHASSGEIAAVLRALLDAGASWARERGLSLRVRRRPPAVAVYLPPPWGRGPGPPWEDLLGLRAPDHGRLLAAPPEAWGAREAALRARRVGAYLSLESTPEGGSVLVFVLPGPRAGDEGRGATTLS